MKSFQFNERSAIEHVMALNYVDRENVFNTVYMLAKYNYHVLGLSDRDNYNKIIVYITKNCEFVFEESIYKEVEDIIKSAKKHSLAIIDKVPITRSEIQKVIGLNDIKQEKAAFVLLAVTKYYSALKQKEYNAAYLSVADICKMARLTIPAGGRDSFMQFAYDKNILQKHSYSDSIIRILTFVSYDEADPVALELTESDFKDLATTYLAYLHPHQYRHCVSCKKWIKKDKKDRRLCKECSDKPPAPPKEKNRTANCIDCNREIFPLVLGTKVCRCEDCQGKVDKILKSDRNARYYASHKNSDGSLEKLDTSK